MPAILQATALALAARAFICPLAPTCPQDDQCTFTANGVLLRVSCATDFYGGDLRLAQTSTLAGCLRACANTEQCAAASYVGQNCYIKSTVTAAQPNPNVVGASVVARAPIMPPFTIRADTACPATYTCPQNNGCIVQQDSRTFQLACGVDYYGGDFMSMPASSFQVCTQACVDSPQCVAASYVGGQNAGDCYLKGTNNGATSNDNVDVSTPTSSTSTATATVTSTSTLISTLSSSQIASPIPSSSTAALSTPPALPSPSSSTFSSPQISSPSPVSSSTSIANPTPTFTPTPTPTSTPVPAPVPAPTNIVRNPGFEDGFGASATAWQITSPNAFLVNTGRLTTNPRRGQFSFQIQAASPSPYSATLVQSLAITPGRTYQVSVWAAEGQFANCQLTLTFNNVPVAPIRSVTSSYSEFVGFVPSGSTLGVRSAQLGIRGDCQTGGTNGRLWIDDVVVTSI